MMSRKFILCEYASLLMARNSVQLYVFMEGKSASLG